MDTLEPVNSTILTHTEWLNRIRPLEVGDLVEVLEYREWGLWGKNRDKYIGSKFNIIDIFSTNLVSVDNYYIFRPHRLRLISRAEKPTEWQPKWGEEVEVSDDGKYWLKEVYVGKHPDKENIMPNVVWLKIDDIIVSYKHIRPIPPKPKTLREEVAELPNIVNIEDVLAIIDRYEKGGENE
jgi:hypothetical protein